MGESCDGAKCKTGCGQSKEEPEKKSMQARQHSPLVCSVSQVALSWLIIIDNGDVGAFGDDVHVAEVLAVGDVGEEEEVRVSPLVQYLEPAAAGVWPLQGRAR